MSEARPVLTIQNKLSHQRKNTMARLNTSTAPDFALQDYHGQSVRLSDFRGDRNVVLVFNRSFM